MKIKQLNSIRNLALLGAIAVGLWSCQQEENTTPDGPGIAVSVCDGGYTGNVVSYDNGTLRVMPQTRSAENGYKTTFTEGDKIGFYSVKNNALMAENVCLTLTNGVWTPPAGVKLTSVADRFFVYYPYKSSPAAVTATATTAEAFFANLIAGWRPATDQSTQAKYTAQDLMTGSGSLGSTPTNGTFPLSVTLSHKMGLAVISLPFGVTDVSFSGFKPYSLNGSNRYLVPTTTTTLKGWFTNLGDAREYTISANIAGGNYTTYSVDKVQVGDYYYSDKTYSTVLDNSKTCIGVVFWVDGSGGGKIVSLDEPVANWNGGTNGAGFLSWGLYGTAIGTTDWNNGATNMTTAMTWLASNGKTLADLPAFKWCNDKGTGWYLPAFNEVLAIYAARASVNAALGSTYTQLALESSSSSLYWSSTESGNSAYFSSCNDAFGYNFVYGHDGKYPKDSNDFRVRAVRSF